MQGAKTQYGWQIMSQHETMKKQFVKENTLPDVKSIKLWGDETVVGYLRFLLW